MNLRSVAHVNIGIFTYEVSQRHHHYFVLHHHDATIQTQKQYCVDFADRLN